MIKNKAKDLYLFIPFGPLKSGIPADVLIPAPVMTTKLPLPFIQSESCFTWKQMQNNFEIVTIYIVDLV